MIVAVPGPVTETARLVGPASSAAMMGHSFLRGQGGTDLRNVLLPAMLLAQRDDAGTQQAGRGGDGIEDRHGRVMEGDHGTGLAAEDAGTVGGGQVLLDHRGLKGIELRDRDHRLTPRGAGTAPRL